MPPKKKPKPIDLDKLEAATADQIMFDKQDTKSEAMKVRLQDGTEKLLRVTYKKGTYQEVTNISKLSTGDEPEKYWAMLILKYSIAPEYESVDEVLNTQPYGFVRSYATRIEAFNSENPFLF